MKKAIALLLGVAAVGSACAQTRVGVSIGINQPGVYGRIDIGDVPPPALVYSQPVLIAPPRVVVREQPPVYLYVPVAHQQAWGRYCGRYGACGQPVYFVQERWVEERYEHEHPGWNRGKHKGWDKHDKGRDGDDDRDRGESHGRGHGRRD